MLCGAFFVASRITERENGAVSKKREEELQKIEKNSFKKSRREVAEKREDELHKTGDAK